MKAILNTISTVDEYQIASKIHRHLLTSTTVKLGYIEEIVGIGKEIASIPIEKNDVNIHEVNVLRIDRYYSNKPVDVEIPDNYTMERYHASISCTATVTSVNAKIVLSYRYVVVISPDRTQYTIYTEPYPNISFEKIQQ